MITQQEKTEMYFRIRTEFKNRLSKLADKIESLKSQEKFGQIKKGQMETAVKKHKLLQQEMESELNRIKQIIPIFDKEQPLYLSEDISTDTRNMAVSAGLLLLDENYHDADILLERLGQQEVGNEHRIIDWCLNVFNIKLDSQISREMQSQLDHSDLANSIRGRSCWWLYPVLLLLDIRLLFQNDPFNLLLAKIKYKTPISYFLKLPKQITGPKQLQDLYTKVINKK